MAEELIRKVCEAANCKYPDMEAMADFKRQVTPAAVIGLLDGLRHAKGVAALNDARANGAAETVQHLRSELATMRLTLPQPAAVEVVAWRIKGDSSSPALMSNGAALFNERNYPGSLDDREPLMTGAQNQRILAASAAKACPAGEPVMWVNPNVIGADMKINWPTAITFSNRGPCHNWTLPLYTHPADQVEDDLTMVKVSRELLQDLRDLAFDQVEHHRAAMGAYKQTRQSAMDSVLAQADALLRS